jgi:preprotein translocase subunit SecF
MELFKRQTTIDFMGYRKLALVFSLLLIAASLGSLAVKGLNFGIDFTGGTVIEVGYEKSVDLAGIRDALSKEGFAEAIVQHFGTTRDVLIRIAPRKDLGTADISSKILEILRKQAGTAPDMRRIEFVGPQIGEELTEQGGLAMLFALAGILAYVWFRFEWQFAIGSVAALIHDVIITVGLFSVAGLEFDLTVLAAILAVIGYSLNDTIVVYDRIRENFRKVRKGSAKEIINISLNQTLSRTLMTSVTTLLVLIALFVLGGEIIHGFALALIIGVIVGNYSSIYVASTSVLMLGISKSDLMPVEKEGAEMESLP